VLPLTGNLPICIPRNRFSGELRVIKLMMPHPEGELSRGFKEAVVETELHQKLRGSHYIARVFSWGTFDGQFLWVLTEWCEHGSLAVHIDGSIDPELRDPWVKQLALGLQHMHALNVIHRDIKPVGTVSVCSDLA